MIIRVYDTTLSLVSEVDAFETAFFERSFYGVGAFNITINKNILQSQAFVEDYFVMFGKNVNKIGVITTIEYSVGSTGKGSELISVSGYEIPFIFSWRVLRPLTGDATYTLTDAAETCMKTLVYDQCQLGADINRRFTNLTIAADLARGSDYTLLARWNTTVLDELQKMAIFSNIGFRVYLDEGNKDLVFDAIVGVDRTALQTVNPRAIFATEWNTLETAQVVESKDSYRNFSYTGGQGIGAARVIREQYTDATEPTSFNRKEIFIDARDLPTAPELDARGLQRLAELNVSTSVNGTALTKSTLVYGTDYDLGDLVTLKALTRTYDARLSVIKEAWSAGNYKIDLTMGREPAMLSDQTKQALDTIKNNLNTLEV